MQAAIKALDPAAMSQHQVLMSQMEGLSVFKRWPAIPELWEPDFSLLHNFGSLPDMDNIFSAAARRAVRCSPQLAAFIEHNTGYKRPAAGRHPEAGLTWLLRACFVRADTMFKGGFSPYQLLCSGKLVMDLAFMRGVVAASKWLGPHVLPTGYISEWPPEPSDPTDIIEW